jgi:lipopolysaccharide assembly protein A
MAILLVIALLVAILAVLFAVQNTAPVTVSLLIWKFENQPLALILLIVLALGVMIGLLATSPGMVKRSFTISGQKKKIDSLEKGLQQNKVELDQTKQALDAKTNPPETKVDSVSQK